jgi:hypothetical protein
VGGAQEHAPDAAPRVSRVDEQQEQLPVAGVDGRVADHSIGLVGRDQQHVRRRVIDNQLVPVSR